MLPGHLSGQIEEPFSPQSLIQLMVSFSPAAAQESTGARVPADQPAAADGPDQHEAVEPALDDHRDARHLLVAARSRDDRGRQQPRADPPHQNQTQETRLPRLRRQEVQNDVLAP